MGQQVDVSVVAVIEARILSPRSASWNTSAENSTMGSIIWSDSANSTISFPAQKEKPGEWSGFSVCLTSLLCAGAIVELETDREDGPFYCLPDYVEEITTLESPALLRSYAAFYEALDVAE